jgi:hypothetical protein
VIEVDVAPAPFSATIAWARSRSWIAAWWLAGRALVLATAVAVHLVGPTGLLAHIVRAHALGALAAWDGRWYRDVAAHGYLLVPGRPSDPAFFPLYPAMLRTGHAVGLGYSSAGIVIANAAFLVALVAFHTLTRDLLGDDLARRATVYLAIFPLGYVFSMAYPESVVLAAIVLAVVAAMRGRWGIAAVCAASAALGRPEGLFVAAPLLVIAWRQRSGLDPARRGLAFGAALASVGALAAYPLYLDRVLHDPTAWSRAERAWGRRFTPLGAIHAIEHVPRAFAGNAWVARDVGATVLYVVLLAAAARAGAPLAWLVAGGLVVVLPVFSGAFTSIGRFGLLAPPVFWGLAWIGRRPRIDLAVRMVSLALLVAATATIPFVFP